MRLVDVTLNNEKEKGVGRRWEGGEGDLPTTGSYSTNSSLEREREREQFYLPRVARSANIASRKPVRSFAIDSRSRWREESATLPMHTVIFR